MKPDGAGRAVPVGPFLTFLEHGPNHGRTGGADAGASNVDRFREDQTMTSFTRFVSRKVIGAVAVFAVAAAAFVGTYAFVADRQPDTATVDLTSEAQAFDAALADPAVALGTSTDDSPDGSRADLRADLRAAMKLQGDARRQALADIRTKAQDGGYGDRIQRRADRRQIHRELFFNLLPDNLQTDLQALKDAPADQRPAMRADIMARAVAGDYGPDVQDAAKKLQALRHG
jgi:hypothetical protein